VLRLRQICLVAERLGPAVAELEAVLGLATCFHDPAVARYGLENALLPVGNDFLEVVAPTRPGTAAGRYLARRGNGGYIVILQCDDIAARRARMAALGVRIVNTLDYGDYLGIQLHPRDTGGSMLETSWSAGGEAPDGPWHPAGDSWRDAVRRDRVTRMCGCELQGDDPAALAARWGDILDRSPTTGADGAAIVLDNATIRFVAATDGRGEGPDGEGPGGEGPGGEGPGGEGPGGEGLCGVDLVAADRAAVVAAARARGCPVAGDTVRLCGMRFRLMQPAS